MTVVRISSSENSINQDRKTKLIIDKFKITNDISHNAGQKLVEWRKEKFAICHFNLNRIFTPSESISAHPSWQPELPRACLAEFPDRLAQPTICRVRR